MTELNVAQWEELKDQYSEIVVDGMDLEDLIAYAQDQLRSYLDNLSYHELKEEIDNNDDELFDELVDNVTQQYPKQDANNPTFHMDQAFAKLEKEGI